MTSFKPGDKVIAHMRDEISKQPVPDCWGLIGAYIRYNPTLRFQHEVLFINKEDSEEDRYTFCDEEIQLLEDE